MMSFSFGYEMMRCLMMRHFRGTYRIKVEIDRKESSAFNYLLFYFESSSGHFEQSDDALDEDFHRINFSFRRNVTLAF